MSQVTHKAASVAKLLRLLHPGDDIDVIKARTLVVVFDAFEAAEATLNQRAEAKLDALIEAGSYDPGVDDLEALEAIVERVTENADIAMPVEVLHNLDARIEALTAKAADDLVDEVEVELYRAARHD